MWTVGSAGATIELRLFLGGACICVAVWGVPHRCRRDVRTQKSFAGREASFSEGCGPQSRLGPNR